MSVIFTYVGINVNIADIVMEIGEQIKTARKRRRMTQEKLALDLGISRPSIIAYEKGKTPPPPDVLTGMARILNVKLEVNGCIIAPPDGHEISLAEQLCFEFDMERTFSGATVRIKPSRSTITITAIIPHHQQTGS